MDRIGEIFGVGDLGYRDFYIRFLIGVYVNGLGFL